MRYLLSILVFGALAALFTALPQFHSYKKNQPINYEAQSAKVKLQYLWSSITSTNNQSASWFAPLQMLELFTESMQPTVFNVSDFFPEGRKKLIHTVAAVAKCKFTFDHDYGYTGLFNISANGPLNALCRAGSSTRPTNTSITPGFAFKILRNGVHSANFFAMWQLDGQRNDLNFFKHPLANHVPDRPDLPANIKAIKIKFQTVSQWPGLVGLSDLAKYDTKGRAVAQPKFPFALVFQPNPVIQANHTGQTNFDVEKYFPTSFKGYEVLYQIYAVPDLTEPPTLLPIGSLRLTSKFVPSKFADEQLFFKHQLIEEDLVHHPEWTPVLATTNRTSYEGAQLYGPFLPTYNCQN